MGRSAGHKVCGKVILLDGPSSSGKSSVARALQAMIEEPFWHYSIDHLRDAGILPLERVRSGDFRWSDLREGFFEGFHASLGAFARAGNNLIVEHIIETRERMERLAEELGGLDVYSVGIHCPLIELERREALRGDRRVGEAQGDFARPQVGIAYDLELDGRISPEENAGVLLAAWRVRTPRSALLRMEKTQD